MMFLAADPINSASRTGGWVGLEVQWSWLMCCALEDGSLIRSPSYSCCWMVSCTPVCVATSEPHLGRDMGALMSEWSVVGLCLVSVSALSPELPLVWVATWLVLATEFFYSSNFGTSMHWAFHCLSQPQKTVARRMVKGGLHGWNWSHVCNTPELFALLVQTCFFF